MLNVRVLIKFFLGVALATGTGVGWYFVIQTHPSDLITLIGRLLVVVVLVVWTVAAIAVAVFLVFFQLFGSVAEDKEPR